MKRKKQFKTNYMVIYLESKFDPYLRRQAGHPTYICFPGKSEEISTEHKLDVLVALTEADKTLSPSQRAGTATFGFNERGQVYRVLGTSSPIVRPMEFPEPTEVFCSN